MRLLAVAVALTLAGPAAAQELASKRPKPEKPKPKQEKPPGKPVRGDKTAVKVTRR